MGATAAAAAAGQGAPVYYQTRRPAEPHVGSTICLDKTYLLDTGACTPLPTSKASTALRANAPLGPASHLAAHLCPPPASLAPPRACRPSVCPHGRCPSSEALSLQCSGWMWRAFVACSTPLTTCSTRSRARGALKPSGACWRRTARRAAARLVPWVRTAAARAAFGFRSQDAAGRDALRLLRPCMPSGLDSWRDTPSLLPVATQPHPHKTPAGATQATTPFRSWCPRKRGRPRRRRPAL